mgnify:CR=1 FL=1
MKLDYLNGTVYKIEQPEEMYHFNSDTELLGRFVHLNAADIVLDIGCATGALLCYAASQNPAKLYGIDLFPEVIHQAEKNLSMNQIAAKLKIVRLQEYHPSIRFDVILCNPPYFATKKEELKNTNPILAAARHESYLCLEDLFCCVSSLLNNTGAFYLVHRADRIPELLYTAEKYDLRPVRMRITYKTVHGDAVGVLLCFEKGTGRQMKLESPVFLDDHRTFGTMEGEGK